MKYPILLTSKLFPLIFSLCILASCENFPGLGGDKGREEDDDNFNDSIAASTTVLDINPLSVTFDGTKDQITVSINARTIVNINGEETAEDADWTIYCEELDNPDCDITISPLSGSGNESITISHISGQPFTPITAQVSCTGYSVVLPINFRDDSETIYIPDETFREYLLNEYDLNDDMELTQKEAEYIEVINIDTKNVASLEGIESMPNLKTLIATTWGDNIGKISSVDVRNNTNIETVCISNNSISILNVANCTKLTSLDCQNNQIGSLDLNGCESLEELQCNNNSINQIAGLISCSKLTNINCSYNKLTKLDISSASNIEKLSCADNTSLYQLTIANNSPLTSINISRTEIKELDLSNNKYLEELKMHACQMNKLNLSGCTAIKELKYGLTSAKITNIDLTDCTSLTVCDLSFMPNDCLWTLSVTGCSALKELTVDYQHVRSVDLSKCTELEEINFRSYATGYPAQGYYHQLNSLDVSACTKLRKIDCGGCLELKNLDLSKNTLLNELIIRGAAISSIDLRHNTLLKTVDAESYSLKTIYLLPDQIIETFKYYTDRTTIVRQAL